MKKDQVDFHLSLPVCNYQKNTNLTLNFATGHEFCSGPTN